MIIYIKNLRGDKTELELEESDTILSIKERLQELQGHGADLQKLILSGKILENSKTALECGIINESTLVLMVSKAKAPAKPLPQVPQVSQVHVPLIPESSPSILLPEPQVPSIPDSLEGPSALVTGDSLTSTINSIVEMGFVRKDVEAAMKAAYNNPDRAIEYLTSGLPEPPLAQVSGNANEQQFRQLMQDPLFMQLLTMVQQNPAALGPILTQLQQSNPEIYNLISSNQETFMRMLQGPSEPSHIDPSLIASLPKPPPRNPGIVLTPEEQTSINNLVELGFSKNDATEAFLICDKNEAMAAEMLFENYQPALKEEQENP